MADPLRVLVACEYSGAVRDAFIARGHDAMSCDLLPTEVPGPHYQGDVCDCDGRSVGSCGLLAGAVGGVQWLIG